MNQEYQYLLGILRAYILEQEPQQDNRVDWEKLLELAQIHNVTGILGYMTMKYPICPDASMKEQLRRNCLANMSLYAQRGAMAEALFSLLSDNGIDHCLMKGILLRELYPVAELRTFTDVDFLIRKEDRQRCHQLMLTSGFIPKNDWEPVYSYTRGPEFYEIHTQIMEIDLSDKADYRGFFDQAWEHTVQISKHSYQLSREFHLLYLLTHIAKHVQGSGAGIRLYLDIGAFLLKHGANVDWGWVSHELDSLALKRFAATVFSAVESWFGVSCPMGFERTEAQVLDRFMEFTMEAGVFGKYHRDLALSTLKKEEGSRFSVLMHRLFPKAEDVQARYTYLQGRHWLLPVAWVHRFLITGGKFSSHAKQAKTILTAQEAELIRLKELSRDIGL